VIISCATHQARTHVCVFSSVPNKLFCASQILLCQDKVVLKM